MKTSKFILPILTIALLAAGCAQPTIASESLTPSPTTHISNISDPVTDSSFDIVPLDYQEGEEVNNLYYRKALDHDGVPCYEVKDAKSGEAVFLPMTETVLYLSDSDPCHYEYYTVKYEEDGEVKQLQQCALYVNVSGEDEATADQPETSTSPSAEPAPSETPDEP